MKKIRKYEFDEKEFKIAVYQNIINAITPYINNCAIQLKEKEKEIKEMKGNKKNV